MKPISVGASRRADHSRHQRIILRVAQRASEVIFPTFGRLAGVTAFDPRTRQFIGRLEAPPKGELSDRPSATLEANENGAATLTMTLDPATLVRERDWDQLRPQQRSDVLREAIRQAAEGVGLGDFGRSISDPLCQVEMTQVGERNEERAVVQLTCKLLKRNGPLNRPAHHPLVELLSQPPDETAASRELLGGAPDGPFQNPSPHRSGWWIFR